MKKKNKEFYIQSYIYQELKEKSNENLFKHEWTINDSHCEKVNKKLLKASKNINNIKKNYGRGKPDLIYCNPETKLLILVELKKSKKFHSSNEIGKIKNPKDYAVDGVLHYSNFFKEYNVFAIAISGTPENYLIDQYFKAENKTENEEELIYIPAERILNEVDYDNIVEEKSIEKEVNNLSVTLDNLNKIMNKNKIKTSERPIILGVIIFAFTHFPQMKTDIEKWKTNTNNIVDTLLKSIKLKMKKILPENKWEENSKIINRFCSLISSYTINEEVWKEIINKVNSELMPIINKMKRETYHDFSGDMYRVLLRYTSGDGKILGQILTPKHIANLMIHLAELKKGDSVIDPACGTGIFLVNSMNTLIKLARDDKEINIIKSRKIYGIEISLEMFFLTLVNMLINDDGKTNIFVDDDNPTAEKRGIFKYTDKDFIEKPTKILMNPPYLSHDEMWKFVLKSMELASEKAVIIISTSILNNNSKFKEEFLKKHSLLSVINMPNNIFQNKGSSGSQVKTSIIVAEINKPNKNNHSGTYLYDLKDDGFISSKKRGRCDGNNKWSKIKGLFLYNYNNKKEITNTSKLIKKISANDSWHFNYYNKININDFKKINEYLFNFLDTTIEKKEKTLLKKEKLKSIILSKYKMNMKSIDISDLDFFSAKDLFIIEKNINKALRIEKYTNFEGNISYVAASNNKNGSRILNTRSIYNETILENKFTWNTQGDGGAGLAFYHPYKFIVASTTMALTLKENLPLHRKIFIAYAMSLEHKNRYHGNSITQKEFNNGNLKITLPISDSKDINWKLIDSFMLNNDFYKMILDVLKLKK